MQTLLMVAVILVLMAPLMLAYGIPFVVAALVLHNRLPEAMSRRTRTLLACGVAALGIAPVFDQFWAPKSIYLRLWEGDAVSPSGAVLSLALTWLVIGLAVTALARIRARRFSGL
jgi:hypothetical protein